MHMQEDNLLGSAGRISTWGQWEAEQRTGWGKGSAAKASADLWGVQELAQPWELPYIEARRPDPSSLHCPVIALE